MWKPFLAALLLLSTALHSLNRVMIVGGYYTSAYAKNCENKASPKMKCGGRCQMMKKLKADEKKDQLPSSRLSEQVLSSKSFYASIHSLNTAHLIHCSNYLVTHLPVSITDFFHPPGIS